MRTVRLQLDLLLEIGDPDRQRLSMSEGPQKTTAEPTGHLVVPLVVRLLSLGERLQLPDLSPEVIERLGVHIGDPPRPLHLCLQLRHPLLETDHLDIQSGLVDVRLFEKILSGLDLVLEFTNTVQGVIKLLVLRPVTVYKLGQRSGQPIVLVTGVTRGLLLGYQRNSVGIMEGERGRVGNGGRRGRLIGDQGVVKDRGIGRDGCEVSLAEVL